MKSQVKKWNRIKATIAGLFLFLSMTTNAFAVDVHAVTSRFAPLQMSEDGKLDGYAVLIVEELLSRLQKADGIKDYKIDLIPWKRAMRTTETRQNVIIFSMSRTEKREEKFQWISEISPYEVYLYKLKHVDLPQIESLQDLKNTNVLISAPSGSNTSELYQQLGLEAHIHYVEYSHYNYGIPMLFRNRFDAIPLTSFVARTNTCALGLDGDQIEQYFPIEALSNPLWIAASKYMDEDLVIKMRDIMSDLHEEGFINKIQGKYIVEWNSKPCEKKPN